MYLRISMTIVVAIATSVPGLSQLNLEWAFSTGSNVSDLTGAMFSDHEDNLYTFGVFRDTVDLDPGPGVEIAFPTTSTAVSTITKYSSDGSYQWTGSFLDKDEVYGGIYEIKYNRVRLALTFTDSLTYLLHGQALIQVAMPGINSCILDLTLDGDVINTQFFATPDEYFLSDIITLPNGQTLLGGSFEGTFSLPGSAQQLVSIAAYDVMLILLDTEMNPVWMRSYGSDLNDYMEKIHYAENGTIYFTFIHKGNVAFESAQGQLEFPGNGEDNCVFGYMDMTGTVQNAFAFGSALGDQIRSITADDARNIYICGYFEDTVNFAHASQTPVVYTPAADSDGFIAKYDPDGLLIWERVYRSGDYGGVYTMSLKRDSELYVSGGITGRSDIDPGPDSLMVDADTRTDVFVSKLTLDGDLLFSYHFPGSDVEGIRALIPSTGTSRVFMQGFFYTDLDCDFTAGEWILNSAGGSDAFLVAFSEDNVFSSTSNVGIHALPVYPNPTSGMVFFASDEPILEVTIVSTDGRIISHRFNTGGDMKELDLSNLSPGMYLISTRTESGMHVARVVRQ